MYGHVCKGMYVMACMQWQACNGWYAKSRMYAGSGSCAYMLNHIDSVIRFARSLLSKRNPPPLQQITQHDHSILIVNRPW